MQKQLEVCDENMGYPRNADNQAFFESCRVRAIDFGRAIPLTETELSSCKTIDIAETAEKFYEDTMRAAAAGDADAQICYIGSRYGLDRPWTKEEVRHYADNAGSYVDQAFARGDWRVVEMFQTTRNMIERYTLLHHVAPYDPVHSYRMNRLLRLGATDGKYAHLLDAVAKHGHESLSYQARVDAELWASRMYALHFSRAKGLSGPPKTCMPSTEAYIPDDE